MTNKTFDKRDRAIKAACKELGSHAVEGIHFKLNKDGKRWGWGTLSSTETQPKAPEEVVSKAAIQTEVKAANARISEKAADVQKSETPVHLFTDKDRVYDVSAPNTHGTVVRSGSNVCEIKWDQKEPWGKTSNTLSKNLILVEGTPEFLKVQNRQPLSGEQKAKLSKIKEKAVTAKPIDNLSPRPSADAEKAVLNGKSAEKKPKTSMCKRVKEILIGNPKVEVDAVLKQLVSEGHNPAKSTVTTVLSDTRDTFRVLVKAGVLKMDL